MRTENDSNREDYPSVFNFEEFFNFNTEKNNGKFIKELKNIIEKYIGEFENKGYKLYRYSHSCIYYPKKLVSINEKNPSVLLVTHELSRTGAPVVALDTAKILTKNGYFVVVISLSEGPLLDEFLTSGIPVVVMKQLKYLQYLHQETEHFVDQLDLDVFVEQFDITLMVTATLYNFIKRYFNTSNKILWWIHEGSESYNILGSSMPKNLSDNIKVLCGGQYAADQLKKNDFHYHPSILNYGVVDTNNNHIKGKNRDEKVRFILAGTIGKRKGQLILLRAIQNISSKLREQAEFIFIGDPYDNDIEGMMIQNELKKYASENSNIIVQSSISREKLYKLYENIDVLVLASIDDPMPVVATENLMLNNICLCSDRTGTSYYIEDQVNGFVFKSEDEIELAQKITYIIQNKNNLEEIKKNGRKIYDEYFEMSIFERNILQLISGEVNES